ncbi:MAG: DUF4038 domain-containing protein [bacterium]
MLRDRRAHVLLALAVVLLSCAGVGRSAPAYPVKKSANGRYLVDQNDVPYLIVGDSPQALIVNITEAQADAFFADRAAFGFNTVWINLLCTTYTGGRVDGSTLDGTRPFTHALPSSGSYDLSTPNEAYFAHVDRVLDLAASHGIQVLLDPIETGGWLTTMLDNGVTACRNYGRYLGTRYHGRDNIVWMSGNDFQGWRDAANDDVVRSVALGILDDDSRHLHTTELDYLVSSSLDDPTWAPILGLNATYTYYPTYARLRQDYSRPSFLPNFMVEANYEFESLQGPVTTAPILRKEEWWTMTSGATGQLYGNGYTWPFQSDWESHLDTPGAVQMSYLRAFFDPRPWYRLVPDTAHAVVTAGYGTYSDVGYVADNDFLTAARSTDGKLVLVYTPIVRTFTVDMTRLSAAAVTRWFDPSAGSYVTVAGSPLPNVGTRNFTPPGNNADGDGGWVLVLETEPPETQPPVVTLTAPAQGAIVSSTVPVTAAATDNVGVVGVQFQIDGANLGGEDLSAPFATSWDTQTVANGSHVVKAVARDLAGNRAADSATVTVSNVIPPPPADHLAAAYAFDESGGLTTADVSGHGNTATLHGAVFGAGEHGSALSFNGTSAYVEAPNSASLDIAGTGLTLAFWVKVISTTSGVDYVIVDKPWSASTMTSPFYQYGVEFSNSSNKTLDFFFGDAAASLHGPYRMSPAPGVWTHVAFTYDGSTVRGYLDGVEALSVADASSLVPRGHSLRLGVDGAYQQFFDGSLDDLRIYDRALTAAEVRATMQAPVTVLVGARPAGGEIPSEVSLSIRGPNPFRARTTIGFALPAAMSAELRVVDVTGRLVRVLATGALTAGRHAVEWDGTDGGGHTVAAGRYFVRLQAGKAERSTSIVRLR